MMFPKHRPIRLKGKAMGELRKQVFARDGNCCVECGSTYWLELSHEIPRSLGGSDTPENTKCRCKKHHIARDMHGCPGHF
jgi:5-methylcytosine-specific restriction endonuclease McrA